MEEEGMGKGLGKVRERMEAAVERGQ